MIIPRGPYHTDLLNERRLWRAELRARRYKFPGERTYQLARTMLGLVDYSTFVRTGALCCLYSPRVIARCPDWEFDAGLAAIIACRRCLVRIGLIRRAGPNLNHFEFLPSFLDDNPPQGTVERIVPRRTSPAGATA